MQEQPNRSRLEQIVTVLLKHGVKFIVIGGQAEYILGSPRVTFDVDLCYERSYENLTRLAAALKELKPKLRDVPPDVTVVLDAHALALGNNYTFDTAWGPLDFLGYVEPIGGYAELAQHAKEYEIDGIKLLVIDLNDLIRIKEHIGRNKDRESLVHLYAIKRKLDEKKD